MLSVQHLNVWYGPTEVLRDVSFTVPDREVVALLGGNGSGKTTILNTLTGLLKPRGGTVRIDGTEATALGPDRIVKLGMAQVPQGREVFATMNVRDNLEMGAATRRDGAGVERDIAEMYELFPILRERRDMRAGSLSGGEQQQLAVARALMARPRILLMDEPSHGLAPIVVEKLVETIRLLHARGMTILLVEQNVGVAARCAEGAHILKDGQIVLSGPAAELVNSREVLRSYLGR
jgi:branched-chain amino acid transport system ATP-binding protein